MGGFTGVLPPGELTNFSKMAEEMYIPPSNESNLTPSIGALVAAGNLFVQPLIYQSWHGKNRINVFLHYKETTEGNMQIKSLEVWNKTNNRINLLTASIQTNPNGSAILRLVYQSQGRTIG